MLWLTGPVPLAGGRRERQGESSARPDKSSVSRPAGGAFACDNEAPDRDPAGDRIGFGAAGKFGGFV